MRRAAYSADSLPPNYNAVVRLPDSSIFYRRCPEKSGIYLHHMVVSRDMTDQLARAGTSVGANMHEAQYAQSKKDFIAKLEIALKESNETSYWLKLMYETKRIDLASYTNMPRNCAAIFADC
jgi:four helix bundle protein